MHDSFPALASEGVELFDNKVFEISNMEATELRALNRGRMR